MRCCTSCLHLPITRRRWSRARLTLGLAGEGHDHVVGRYPGGQRQRWCPAALGGCQHNAGMPGERATIGSSSTPRCSASRRRPRYGGPLADGVAPTSEDDVPTCACGAAGRVLLALGPGGRGLAWQVLLLGDAGSTASFLLSPSHLGAGRAVRASTSRRSSSSPLDGTCAGRTHRGCGSPPAASRAASFPPLATRSPRSGRGPRPRCRQKRRRSCPGCRTWTTSDPARVAASAPAISRSLSIELGCAAQPPPYGVRKRGGFNSRFRRCEF